MKIILSFILLMMASNQALAYKAPAAVKKLSDKELRQKLTPLQYKVTQKEGTEPAYKNRYWDHKEAGIYVDIVSGEPLFSSLDKYDSKTGWPSFTRPLVKEAIVYKEDKKLFSTRTEVRSKQGDSHLGHVFDDGPKPSGKRYCLNSASLRFVAAKDLKKGGYGKFASLFDVKSTKVATSNKSKEIATLAGGCFWCVEAALEKVKGVSKVISGFSGGKLKNPAYKLVASGKTKHREVVQAHFDPNIVSYKQILQTFWRNIDPTDPDGMFVDRGLQYSSAIYYHSEAQRKTAIASKAALEKSKIHQKKVITPILPYKNFYAAEDYHQDYYKKNPIRYRYYHYRSGRPSFLKKVYGR